MPVIIFNKNQEYDATWCDEVVSVMRPNILGNPFPIGGRNTRDFVIQNYRGYLQSLMTSDTQQRREIERLSKLHLAGKTIALICCCVPLNCHADIIKEFILIAAAKGWTKQTADAFLFEHHALLQAIGFNAQIIGSVATCGSSANDLDLLFKPIVIFTLEEAITRIENEILPVISTDTIANPLESVYDNDDGNSFFINIKLFDGRIVEFYISANDFPWGEEP